MRLGRWRETHQRIAGVAQLAEQLICNQQVAGSSPIAGSRPMQTVDEWIVGRSPTERQKRLENDEGKLPERLKGTDCKSVGYAYVGSNPTLPIR